MIKKILKKIKVIIKIIIKAPYSTTIVFSNFISSFLSIIGIPLLVVAYQYSESLNKNLIPFYDTLSSIFSVIGIELGFYSLIGIAFFLIIFGQTCFGIVEILNRYVQIKVVKEFSINLIKNFKNANWLNILEDKSGKFQYAMVAWIVGDVGWITYDFYISNFSHLALSSIIIVLNLYGIWNIKRMQNGGVK